MEWKEAISVWQTDLLGWNQIAAHAWGGEISSVNEWQRRHAWPWSVHNYLW